MKETKGDWSTAWAMQAIDWLSRSLTIVDFPNLNETLSFTLSRGAFQSFALFIPIKSFVHLFLFHIHFIFLHNLQNS